MKKRDESRARKRVMVRYGLNGPEKTGFTKNLSKGGLHIQTNSIIVPGKRIQIELKFGDRTFSMWGVVAWAKKVPPQLAYTIPSGIGVKFLDPPAEWLDFFEEWSAAKPARR